MAADALPCTITNADGRVLHAGDLADAPKLWFDAAVIFVRDGGEISAASLQREFGIGFHPAVGLLDRLEREGVVCAPDAKGKRALRAPSASRRRLVSERAALEQLARDLAVAFPGLANQAPRIAGDVARDLSVPLAEMMGLAWRAVADHALFDTELEPVKAGDEQASTDALCSVLDYASALLQGRAAALQAARALSARQEQA